MMEFIIENQLTILMALLAVSEVLAKVDVVKSNSVFELIVNSLKKLASK